jgi:hypothetical protein
MPVEHTWGVPEYFSALYDTEEKRNQVGTGGMRIE